MINSPSKLINFFYGNINTTDDIGRCLAGASFIFGSVILLGYIISQNNAFVMTGLFFVIICACINLGILLMVLVRIIKELIRKNPVKSLIITGLSIIANIPITILYFYIFSRSSLYF